jgi:Ras-related protein Rab-11A
VVKKDVADRFARENGLSFLETSALEKTNVDKAFDWLVKSVYDVVVSGPIEAANKPAINKGGKNTGAVNLAAGAGDDKKPRDGKKCSC